MSKKKKTKPIAKYPGLRSKPSKRPIQILLIVLAVLIAAVYVIYKMQSEQSEVLIPSLQEQLIPGRPDNVDFKKNGYLFFVSKTGDTLSQIDIELVNDDYKRSLGLMYRSEMAHNQGMLFIFPSVEPRGFWMKNTELPLDMIFVDNDKKIVRIFKDAVPHDEGSYECAFPNKYVVEVNAGFTDQHKISEGDKIVFVIESL